METSLKIFGCIIGGLILVALIFILWRNSNSRKNSQSFIHNKGDKKIAMLTMKGCPFCKKADDKVNYLISKYPNFTIINIKDYPNKSDFKQYKINGFPCIVELNDDNRIEKVNMTGYSDDMDKKILNMLQAQHWE